MNRGGRIALQHTLLFTAALGLGACVSPGPRAVRLAAPLSIQQPVAVAPVVWSRERTVVQRAPQGYAGFALAFPQIQALEGALRESFPLNGAIVSGDAENAASLRVVLELRQYALAANIAGAGEFRVAVSGIGRQCEERFFAAARADSSEEIFARIGEAAIDRTLAAFARCSQPESPPYALPREFSDGRAVYFASRAEALAFLPRTLPQMECASYITDAYGMRCQAYIFRDLPAADWSQYLTD